MLLKERVAAKKSNLTETRLRPRKNEVTNKNFVILSQEEKEGAERLLVAAIQSQHFEKEILKLLKLGVATPNAMKELRSKNSRLTSLSPFLDKDNLIRAGGRIEKAKVYSYDMRNPMVLPDSKDENVRALIREYHVKNLHSSQQQTFSSLKQKFHILGGKNAVNMVLSKCIVCQRAFKNPSPQREGDLPEDRLQIVAPFAVSGADVFGPYPVRHGGRGTTKRWVLLVTCMVTRAIALFPLKDMTSATVINALVRLNSQFPSVKKLYSDNGSNFRSADRELKEVTDKWNKNDLDRQLGDIGITWVFGPANCGSYGGVWERMVGLVKKHFKATIKDHVLDLDVFETFLAGVTSVVNKRPILEASSNVDDFLVLSPSHFLYPYILTDSSNSILPPSTDGGDALRKSWHATQQLLDEFWEIFKKDYITSLAKKTKWRNFRNFTMEFFQYKSR